MDCDDVMLLVAVGVHSRTLSGSEEEQLHAHLASCEACRALTDDTEHDRPRRIARSSAEPVSVPRLPELIELPEPPGLPTVDPGIDFLDDDHVIVSGRTGRLEIIEVSGRRPGPPRTVPEVLRRVGDSPRWRVANGRVVERP